MRAFIHLLTLGVMCGISQLSPLYSQTNEHSLAFEGLDHGTSFTFHSKVMNENREIWVKVPEQYDSQDTIQYPVIYVLDARSNFHFTASLAQQLTSKMIPESIVVGITNTDRVRDLTTPTKNPSQVGQAATFLRMVENELMPTIDKNYQTAGFRTIVGHSFGGLTVLYSLINFPALFDAYIAISPSLWWENQKLVQEIESALSDDFDHSAIIYLGVANERGLLRGGVLKLAGILESLNKDNIRWDYEIYQNENHGSVPLATQIDGFNFIFEDWNVKDLKSFYLENGNTGLDNKQIKD